MLWKDMELTGWGRSSRARVRAARPERERDVMAALRSAEGPLLAYGGGRSYGDAALNDGGHTILTERLNRILSFDPASGELVAEPGVTFRDLLDVFLPRGFLVPVSPGTAFATLGGAVANDVHGKNHESRGSFGQHLRWIDLLSPDGELVRLSPTERPDLFAATVGGLGLTGVILAVCLRLMRVPGNAVALRERRASNLDDVLAAFAGDAARAHYSVAWIDAVARGRTLGRGIVESADPSDVHVARAPAKPRTVPVDFPAGVLNRHSVAAFNALYYRRVPATGRERLVDYGRFLYPLDALLQWNRIYGRAGFRQFQCVVPMDAGERALPRLLNTVAAAGSASFLAVLKRLGAPGPGYLSFPMPGYTLALDLRSDAGTLDLMRVLERITLDHGGRVYLAKDSCLSPEGFRAMYPRLDRFQAVLDRIDPRGRFQSDLARRLRLRDAAPQASAPAEDRLPVHRTEAFP